jgi:dolichol-phosphate mannosyltransferase
MPNASSNQAGTGNSTATPAAPRVLISLATYNERENLPALVQEIHSQVPSADILVIDDNSPDGTGRLADGLAAQGHRVHVLHRPGKLGLGTAILAAVRYAIEHDYDLFINMDADFSHPPRYLPALLEGMRDHDVMIGSRYIPGGGTVNWPFSRRFMSRAVNVLVRLLLRIPARDTSGAYRCYRVGTLRAIDLDHFLSRGYSFQEEMLHHCHRAGCRLGETPIVFENRRAGTSKVGIQESVRSLAILVWLGLRSLVRPNAR